ncbi:leucine-rich repeat domain-containing protein [Wukongibacter baidiensis]
MKKKLINIIVLIVVIISISSISFAEKEYVDFPDENLEQVIRQLIHQPEGAILKKDLEKIDKLFITAKPISSLEGIQYIKNLRELRLLGCKLENIELLSNLKKLQTLALAINKIKDISPLSELSDLRDVKLGSNEIEDISPLTKLENLHSIYIGSNNIKSIKPLTSMKNLRNLSIGSNEISDYSYLKSIKNLEHLGLEGTKLKDINLLKDLTHIRSLSLNRTNLKNISLLSNFSNLQELYLSDNKIEDLSPLSGLTKLVHVSLYNNQIVDLTPIKHLTNLKSLYLNENKIKDYTPIKFIYPNLYRKDFKCEFEYDTSIEKEITSKDGLTFKKLSDEQMYLEDIITNGSTYIASGENGLFISDDLSKWSYIESIGSTNIRNPKLFLNRNQFIFFQEDFIYASEDGIEWEEKKVNFPKDDYKYNVMDFYAAKNKYILICEIYPKRGGGFTAPSILISHDLTTFREAIQNNFVQSIAGPRPLYCLVWTGGRFLSAGNGSAMAASSDGEIWEGFRAESLNTNSISGIGQLVWNGNQIFALASGGVYSSTDGENWNAKVYMPKSRFHSLLWNGETYLVMGEYLENKKHVSTFFLISKDGENWDEYTIDNDLKSVIWDKNCFIAVGDTVMKIIYEME